MSSTVLVEHTMAATASVSALLMIFFCRLLCIVHRHALCVEQPANFCRLTLTQSAIPSNIPKRMRRILANRASAARSKERKKAIIELEEQVAELQQLRGAHEGQMHELRTSNATLGAGLANRKWQGLVWHNILNTRNCLTTLLMTIERHRVSSAVSCATCRRASNVMASQLRLSRRRVQRDPVPAAAAAEGPAAVPGGAAPRGAAGEQHAAAPAGRHGAHAAVEPERPLRPPAPRGELERQHTAKPLRRSSLPDHNTGT